jgi:hypothetical protein
VSRVEGERVERLYHLDRGARSSSRSFHVQLVGGLGGTQNRRRGTEHLEKALLAKIVIDLGNSLLFIMTCTPSGTYAPAQAGIDEDTELSSAPSDFVTHRRENNTPATVQKVVHTIQGIYCSRFDTSLLGDVQVAHGDDDVDHDKGDRVGGDG